MTQPPVITHDFDIATGRWRLYATSYNTTEPAGPRLFRGGEIPSIGFSHEDEENARRDAALLAAYIRDFWPKKSISKQQMRKERA